MLNGGGDNEAGGRDGGGAAAARTATLRAGPGQSQADAVAAAEVVRRMLEGAAWPSLHSRSPCPATTAAPTGEQFYASAATMSTAYGDDGGEANSNGQGPPRLRSRKRPS